MRPSRCPSFGSLGSVTMPGSSQSPRPSRGSCGRNPSSQRANSLRRQDAADHVGLRQAGGEEVLARGLVVEGAAAIAQVEALHRRGEHLAARAVADRPRPVERQAEREGGLVVLADADRFGELRQPARQPLRAQTRQRRDRGRPFPGLRVVPLHELRVELEQPGETVGSLEGDAPRALQVAHLGRDPLGREARGQRGARPRREGRVGIGAGEPRQQPVTVHRRVPVVAAVERGRQRARRQHVRVARQRMGELVRVLLVDAGQRQVGEALDGGRRQGLGRVGDCGGAGQRQEGQEAVRCKVARRMRASYSSSHGTEERDRRPALTAPGRLAEPHQGPREPALRRLHPDEVDARTRGSSGVVRPVPLHVVEARFHRCAQEGLHPPAIHPEDAPARPTRLG